MSEHDWPDPSPDSPGEKRWTAMTEPSMKKLIERIRAEMQKAVWHDDYQNQVVAWVDIEFILDKEARAALRESEGQRG